MTSRWRTAAAICRLAPWYVAFGAVKRFVPLATLVRWSYRPASGRAGLDPRQIAANVLRTGDVTGIPDRDCLQRSLVLYRELSGAGLNPELAVGFKYANGRLAGHAWVSVAGSIVAEPDLDASGFTQILRFGERGRLISAAPFRSPFSSGSS
jgi:hypothetical protein